MSAKTSLLASVAFATLVHLPAAATADSMSLVRIATMPSGAEVTGLSSNAMGDLFLNA